MGPQQRDLKDWDTQMWAGEREQHTGKQRSQGYSRGDTLISVQRKVALCMVPCIILKYITAKG